MAGKYQLRRDSLNRIQADIADDATIGIKILSVTDARRIEKGTHAYCVLDIRTSLGVLRIRDIRIQFGERTQKHFLRWRQWPTGRMRRGEDRPEYLDVCGPLDPKTRSNYGDAILDVFNQIKEEAGLGTLGSENPGLSDLKDSLEKHTDEAVEATGEAKIDGIQEQAEATVEP